MKSRMHTLDLERFEQKHDNILATLLRCGSIATRSQLEAHLGRYAGRRAARLLLEHRLAKQLPLFWRRRQTIGLTQRAGDRYELMFGPHGHPIPYRWTPTAVRYGLARMEYFLRTGRYVAPFDAESLKAAYVAVSKAVRARTKARMMELAAMPRLSAAQARENDELRRKWIDSNTLAVYAKELPRAGMFVRADTGLHLVFVDNTTRAARYKALAESVTNMQARFAHFTAVHLEVICDAPGSKRVVERQLAGVSNAQVLDLGYARYLMAPRELKSVFSTEEIKLHAEALLGRR